METTLVLDLLFVVIVALFVPIGLWRGPTKEVAVSAALLLGAALAGSWAPSWGDDLAAVVGLRAEVTRFLVALGTLILCTAGLGYGGGAALRSLSPGPGARVIGGLLAAVNGALLLGFVLRFVERYLLDGEPVGALDDGLIANLLLHHFGWLLIVAALVALLCVAIGITANVAADRARRADALALAGSEGHERPSAGGARVRPVRVPTVADGGKFEPSDRDETPPVDHPGIGPWHTWRPAQSAAPVVSPWSSPNQDDVGPTRDRGNGDGPVARFGPTRGTKLSADAARPSGDPWLRRAAATSPATEGEAGSGVADQRTRALPAHPNGEGLGEPQDSGRLPDPDHSVSITHLADVRRSGTQAGVRGRTVDGPGAADAAMRDEPVVRLCVTCGVAVHHGDAFCQECGANL